MGNYNHCIGLFARVLALLLLSAIGATVIYYINPPAVSTAGAIAQISLSDARALNPVWVDSRNLAEYSRGHFPGAIRVGLDDYDEGLAAFVSAWRPGLPIVVYCDASCSSAREVASRLVASLGQVNISVLTGGYPNEK